MGNRKRALMLKALELSRDNPGRAQGWYRGLSGADRTLLDEGLRELAGVLNSIQACANAPKRALEEAIASL